MKKDLKVFLGTNTGLLYKQATKAFAKSRCEISTAARPGLTNVMDAIKVETPDIILLDMSTADFPGKKMVDCIRAQFPETPVILNISAEALSENMNFMGTVADVVVEPYEPAELLMRVEYWVGKFPTLCEVDVKSLRTARVPLVSELHDPTTGRISASKLADYLGLPLASLAKAIGKDYKAVHKTPSAEALQASLAPIHRAVVALDRYFNGRAESLAWLNTAHPELDAKRPKDLILEGKAEVVADMLEGALAGVTA